MSLADILKGVQSSNANERDSANAILEQQKEANPCYLLEQLASVLGSEEDALARQLAGLLIKNMVSNITKDDKLVDLWSQIPAPSKENIRTQCLAALAAENTAVSRSAGQAVAAIAKEEFSKGQWLDLIDVLVLNASNVNPLFRISSLLALGYICEQLRADTLEASKVNQILTAIANSVSESTPEIKVAALQAFKNCLAFAKGNFAVPEERNFMFQMILNSAMFNVESVRIEAFQVLCEISERYYDFLVPHLNEISELTFKLIESDSERVGMLAIEVWNLIADVEIDRIENLSPEKPMRGFISTAGAKLMDLILRHISRSEDSEDWNLTRACGSLLSAVTQITKDKYLDSVSNFLTAHTSLDWQSKKLAAMVLGCVLEGPSTTKVQNLVLNHLQFLINCLQEQVESVKECAAWTLARICQLHSKVVTQPAQFAQLVPALCKLLQEDSPTACNSCWALINLIDHSAESRLFNRSNFDPIMNALFQAAQRPGISSAAFSAISTLVEKSAEDCLPNIMAALPGFVDLLVQGVHSPESLSSSFSSVLRAIFHRAQPSDVPDDLADKFMQAQLTVFTAKGGPTEEGLHAIAALASAIEGQFYKYLQSLGPYLEVALKNIQTVDLCKAGIMLAGDIARALGAQCGSIANDLARPLSGILVNVEAHGDLKVQSIGSLADVAANAKEAFVPFLPDIMTIMTSAAQLTLEEVKKNDDIDKWEYLLKLREAIAQFYEGCIQGQLDAQNAQGIMQYVPGIVQFVLSAVHEKFTPSQALNITCIGIIGDLANAYRSQIKELLKVPQVNIYLSIHRNSNNIRIREVANWAFNIVNYL